MLRRALAGLYLQVPLDGLAEGEAGSRQRGRLRLRDDPQLVAGQLLLGVFPTPRYVVSADTLAIRPVDGEPPGSVFDAAAVDSARCPRSLCDRCHQIVSLSLWLLLGLSFGLVRCQRAAARTTPRACS